MFAEMLLFVLLHYSSKKSRLGYGYLQLENILSLSNINTCIQQIK